MGPRARAHHLSVQMVMRDGQAILTAERTLLGRAEVSQADGAQILRPSLQGSEDAPPLGVSIHT